MNEIEFDNSIYISLMAAFLVTAIITTSVGVITNEFVTEGRYSVSDLGYVVSARSFGYLLGASISVKAFEKISYLKVVPVYFLLIAGTMVALFYQESMFVLAAAFFVFGILKNLITVGGNQISTCFYKGGSKQPLLNHLHFIYGIGTFISPIAIGYVLAIHGTKVMVSLFIGISLLASLLLFRNSSEIGFGQRSAKDLSGSGTNFKVIFLINLFFTFYSGFEIFIGTWGNYIMSNKMNNLELVYWGNALFWLSLAFSKIIVNKVFKNRIKQNLVVYSSATLTGVLTFCFMKTNRDIPILAIMISLGLCMGNIMPSTIKYLSDSDKISSGETAWCFVGAGIGGIIFSKIFSNIFVHGIKFAFFLAFFQLFGILGTFTLLSSKERIKNNN